LLFNAVNMHVLFADGRKLVKIGAEFNTTKRGVSRWICEDLFL
jgi:hypothetical protein